MNHKIIKVKLGEVFEVSLDSNPSTGNRWEADFDTEFVKLKEKSYIPLSSKFGGGVKNNLVSYLLSTGKLH